MDNLEPDMNFADQISLVKASKMVHVRWYMEQYPDVRATDLHPVEHYLRIGADLGRNPGKSFDTRFYTDSHEQVAASGLNPLVHYLLQGQAQGLPCRPERDRSGHHVQGLRTRLLELGFTDAPLAELASIASGAGVGPGVGPGDGPAADAPASPAATALAARTLALWHLRSGTADGFRQALAAVEQARAQAPVPGFHRRLTTIELLCHAGLDDPASGLAAYERAALAGHAGPDAFLARAGLLADPVERLAWVNAALAHGGLTALQAAGPGDDPRDGLCDGLRDRLVAAEPRARGADGPLVSVILPVLCPTHAASAAVALRMLCAQSWQALEILLPHGPDVLSGACEAPPDGQDGAGLAALAAQDARIRLLPVAGDSLRFGAANQALAVAEGEFVTLLLAHQRPHPQRIEKQLRALEASAQLMGCTAPGVWADAGLRFGRPDADGDLITADPDTLMFRRAPVQAALGFWDALDAGAGAELCMRLVEHWGADALRALRGAPLQFNALPASHPAGSDAPPDPQADPDTLAGLMRVYRDSRMSRPPAGAALLYGPDRGPVGGADRFPAPRLLLEPARRGTTRDGTVQNGTVRHYDVILASDFRMIGGSTLSSAQELACHRKFGIRTAVFPMYRYDFGDMERPLLPQIRDQIDGEDVDLVTGGDRVSCDLLLLRYPPVLQHRLRHLPQVAARDIRVIVNQPPMSDYGPDGVVRYELARCAENLRAQFGRDATWHPIGPLVRDTLTTRHIHELGHIALSDQDWHNIIDLAGWDRGPRRRGPGDKLRIGRHSRDHEHKWPASRDDILAAWPDSPDLEVHVLGGANAPAALLGHVPSNWVVHPFGSRAPRDFLADLDVWIYFDHPDWVESFGRTIIEAMAVGVPVILPEAYRPLFGDAALYATPQTAVDIARRLHADPAAHAAQAARAQAHVRAQFSYEMHLERLRAAGVGQTRAPMAGA